jgi:hypothetical protein
VNDIEAKIEALPKGEDLYISTGGNGFPCDHTDDIGLTTDDLKTLVSQLSIAKEALKRIAAFDDKGANEMLEKRGIYAAFDEPGSVRIARTALDRLADKHDAEAI